MIIIKIIITLLVIAINIADAYSDSKSGTIKHFKEAILYSVICVVALLPFYLIFDFNLFWFIGHIILCRAALFDPIINLFNKIGKWFTYNGSSANARRSIVDRFEDWTGLSIFWLRIIYFTVYVIFLIFFYDKA